jgi:hypothetical protein
MLHFTEHEHIMRKEANIMIEFLKQFEGRYIARNSATDKTATIIAYEAWVFGRVRRKYRVELDGVAQDVLISTIRDAKRAARRLLK